VLYLVSKLCFTSGTAQIVSRYRPAQSTRLKSQGLASWLFAFQAGVTNTQLAQATQREREDPLTSVFSGRALSAATVLRGRLSGSAGHYESQAITPQATASSTISTLALSEEATSIGPRGPACYRRLVLRFEFPRQGIDSIPKFVGILIIGRIGPYCRNTMRQRRRLATSSTPARSS
jgi:hypothetical protein